MSENIKQEDESDSEQVEPCVSSNVLANSERNKVNSDANSNILAKSEMNKVEGNKNLDHFPKSEQTKIEKSEIENSTTKSEISVLASSENLNVLKKNVINENKTLIATKSNDDIKKSEKTLEDKNSATISDNDSDKCVQAKRGTKRYFEDLNKTEPLESSNPHSKDVSTNIASTNIASTDGEKNPTPTSVSSPKSTAGGKNESVCDESVNIVNDEVGSTSSTTHSKRLKSEDLRSVSNSSGMNDSNNNTRNDFSNNKELTANFVTTSNANTETSPLGSNRRVYGLRPRSALRRLWSAEKSPEEDISPCPSSVNTETDPEVPNSDATSSQHQEEKFNIPVKSKTRGSNNSKGRSIKTKPLSKYRRITANSRERDRMKQINKAFETLRAVLPTFTNCRISSMTKHTTLQLASSYIRGLSELLDETSSGDCERKKENRPSYCHNPTEDLNRNEVNLSVGISELPYGNSHVNNNDNRQNDFTMFSTINSVNNLSTITDEPFDELDDMENLSDMCWRTIDFMLE